MSVISNVSFSAPATPRDSLEVDVQGLAMARATELVAASQPGCEEMERE